MPQKTEDRKTQASLIHSYLPFHSSVEATDNGKNFIFTIFLSWFSKCFRNFILLTAPSGQKAVYCMWFLCILYMFMCLCPGAGLRRCFVYVFFKHRGFILQQWQMVLKSRQRQEAQGSQQGTWAEQLSIRRPQRRAGVMRFDLCFWNKRVNFNVSHGNGEIVQISVDPLDSTSSNSVVFTHV